MRLFDCTDCPQNAQTELEFAAIAAPYRGQHVRKNLHCGDD